MKNNILIILILVLIISLFSCSKESQKNGASNLKIDASFYFSSDAGKTYGNRTKEFKSGETVYMQIKIKVEDFKQSGYKPNKKPIIIGAVIGAIIGFVLGFFFGIIGAIPGGIVGALAGIAIGVYILPATSPNEIIAQLSIPNIESVDSKLYDGRPIKSDIEENNVIYNLVIPVSKSNDIKESEFTFQFIPKEPTEITMSLIFDNSLSQYNTQNTIRFIK